MADPIGTSAEPHHRRSRTQDFALLAGTVFLVVGIAGFIPGLTQSYDELRFLGNSSGAELLGIFQVSILHNVVHLLFGFAGLALYSTAAGARSYLFGGGATYLVLWLYGVLTAQRSGANFVPMNTTDDYLHLALGLGMIALGVLGSRARRARGVQTA